MLAKQLWKTIPENLLELNPCASRDPASPFLGTNATQLHMCVHHKPPDHVFVAALVVMGTWPTGHQQKNKLMRDEFIQQNESTTVPHTMLAKEARHTRVHFYHIQFRQHWVMVLEVRELVAPRGLRREGGWGRGSTSHGLFFWVLGTQTDLFRFLGKATKLFTYDLCPFLYVLLQGKVLKDC